MGGRRPPPFGQMSAHGASDVSQFSPSHPPVQWHAPSTHVPRPAAAPQSPAHTLVPQSAPAQPSSHTQHQSRHEPWPEQPLGHVRASHPGPAHPGSHVHVPREHTPRPEHPDGQSCRAQPGPPRPGAQ